MRRFGFLCVSTPVPRDTNLSYTTPLAILYRSRGPPGSQRSGGQRRPPLGPVPAFVEHLFNHSLVFLRKLNAVSCVVLQ